MNLLLFTPEDLNEEGHLLLRGERAKYLAEIQGVSSGDVLKIGLLNGNWGQGRVERVSGEEVLVQPLSLNEPPVEMRTELVIALPRPQMLKRILQTAATMGVYRLSFIRSARVVKSYFSSEVLLPERIESELRLGLEQGIATKLPTVAVYDSFRPFVEDRLPTFVREADLSLLAHPVAEDDISSLHFSGKIQPKSRVLIAIGPEGGWKPHEVEAFEASGLTGVSLGERILRVETAVCALLAQLELLRKLDSCGVNGRGGKIR